MFDNKKYIECPREEATHVWFGGREHFISPGRETQSVFWCAISDTEFAFFAPNKHYGDHYMIFDSSHALKGTTGPVFLKEKELEVKFAWSNYPGGTLAAEIAGVATALIVFKKQCIRKPGEANGPNAIKFDDDWTIRQIKDAAAEYARKVARGEL